MPDLGTSGRGGAPFPSPAPPRSGTTATGYSTAPVNRTSAAATSPPRAEGAPIPRRTRAPPQHLVAHFWRSGGGGAGERAEGAGSGGGGERAGEGREGGGE